MNWYVFHWRDGERSEGEGETPEDAFTKLGYGAGAVKALDYWEGKVPDDMAGVDE